MPRVDHHAVVVGIAEYPGFTPLAGPCHDADDVRDWLVSPTGGDVDPANVRHLVSATFPKPLKLSDAHPWLDEIVQLFDPHLEAGMAGPFVGERIYIYMAGHGFSVSDPMSARHTALYAANAATHRAPHLVGTLFAEWFRVNAVFREIVLVMDCCRTIDPLHGLGSHGLVNLPGRAAQAKQVKTFYAHAVGWGLPARERKMNGETHGIFTTTVLQALERARPDANGNVTGAIVRDYVHHNIDDVAKPVTVDPPNIDVDEKRDLTFLTRAVHLSRLTVRLEPFAGGEVVVVQDGVFAEVTRTAAPTQEVVFDLAPGLYKIVIDGTPRSGLLELGGSDEVLVV